MSRSNRISVLVDRKVATLIIAIIMLASGLWVVNTFSSPVLGQQTIAKGVVSLNANGQKCITYEETQTGDYYFQIDSNVGNVQVYFNHENGTVGYWPNGTTEPMTPNFNDSSGQFMCSVWVGPNQSITRYIVFSNPDAISKEVNYMIIHPVTYKNYFGFMAGLALANMGASTFVVFLINDKLPNFNRAIENKAL